MDFLSTSHRRKLFFTLLYFCEGAPIGFIWWMLPTQLRIAGISVEQITLLTSLLVLPWAFKFLWAPAVDTFQSQRWNLKSWIMSAQAMMIITLLPLLILDFTVDYQIIFFLLLLHTFSAATQDVAIDALCISTVPKQEQGRINGWMQVGMLTGRSVFGGGALMAASLIGISFVLSAMIIIIGGVTLLLFLTPVRYRSQAEEKSLRETFHNLRTIAGRRSTWIGLAFAVFGGFAYEGVGIVAGPFFVDRGIGQTQIGFFFSFVSVGAMIAGALIGGGIGDRFGKQRTVQWMTAAMASSVLLLSLIDLVTTGSAIVPLFSGMTLVYFSIGLFTSSTYALFMNVTDERLGATQFSAYMGGTNVCESLAGITVGKLIASFGYPPAFAAVALVSLASVILVPMIRTDSKNVQ